MSDISLEVLPAPEVVALGDQPTRRYIKTEAEAIDIRTECHTKALAVLQRITEAVEAECAVLPETVDSRAMNSLRSHLAGFIGQSRYLLSTLVR
jgi:hypothetical protein